MFPETTPECGMLLNMVMGGLKASLFDERKREAARAALRRLRDKRRFKALEYVIQVTAVANPP